MFHCIASLFSAFVKLAAAAQRRATITSDKRFPPHSLVFPTRTKLFQPNLISRKMLQTRVVLQTDVAKPETGSKLRTSRNHIELSIRCNWGQFGLYLQSWEHPPRGVISMRRRTKFHGFEETWQLLRIFKLYESKRVRVI